MLSRTIRTSFKLALCMATAAIAIPSSANAESLQDALNLAIETYPSIEEAKANRRAQEYEMKQRRGLYLPSLDVRAAAGPEWTKNQTVRNGKTMPHYDTQASLSLLLFDGFGRENGIERTASRVDAASNRVTERTEEVSLAVTRAYLDVLRNEELVELAEDNASIHEELTDKVRERVNGGESGSGDLQQSLARTAVAQSNLVKAREDLSNSRAEYIELLNQSPAELDEVDVPEDAIPEDLDEAIRIALENSPTLLASGADLDEAYAVHRQAKSEYWPKFELIASGGRDHNISGIRGLDSEGSIMLTMSYNLFRGNIDKNRRMEMAERVTEANSITIRLERAIAKEVRRGWNARTAAESEKEIFDQQVISNSQVVSAYRQEFDIGQRDLLDLLDAENELFNAQSNAVEAQYNRDFSVFRLLSAMGALNKTLGIAIPEETKAYARKDAGVTPVRTSPFITRAASQEQALGE